MAVLMTLLVDSVDIRSLSGVTVNRLDLFAPGVRRGVPDVIPGQRGQLGAELPLDAYAFNVAITIDTISEATFYTAIAAIGTALAGDNGLVTLTRRIPTGTSTYVDHTADGQFTGGFGAELANVSTMQTELQFINLSGAWTPDGGTTWLVP